VGSVSAGGTASGSWTSDGDYTIKKIIVVEKSGTELYNVTATLRIDEFTFTKDVVPLYIFQQPINRVPELNYNFTSGKKFIYSITNNSASAVEIFIVLVLEAPE